MANQNFYHHFLLRGCSDPRALLLETPERLQFTFADAERLSSQLAAHVAALGLQPGDRVTVQVETSPAALWLYLACLRAGLVLHPLNTAYQAGEMRYFLADAEPALVVCYSRSEALISNLATEVGVPRVHTLNADGTGTLRASLDASGSQTKSLAPVERGADDLAAVVYSSGTTGRPKGVMLSHGNLYENAATLTRIWGFSSNDRLLHALPIFHVHGLFVALGCVFLSGASMVWLPGFKVPDVLAFLPRCSVFMGVPTYYTRLLGDERFGRPHCAQARLFICGSAPLLESTFAEFKERTGHVILERYGMTEAGMNTSNPLHGERKPGTVGLALPGVDVTVVDESGGPPPVKEAGNVQVRGPNVFKGYWNLQDKTAEEFTPDGWFNTGDKGSFDEEDHLALAGRSSDMIISGGLNVYPKDIENLLDSFEGVEESAVIGVPHVDFGEAVTAVLVLSAQHWANERAVIDAVRGELADFKVPKRVLFLNELPRNTMGKVQKSLLRERYADCCQPRLPEIR